MDSLTAENNGDKPKTSAQEDLGISKRYSTISSTADTRICDRHSKLTCPRCAGVFVSTDSDELRCSSCETIYQHEGIIDFLLDKSKRTALEQANYDATAGYNDKMIQKISQQWLTVFGNAGIDINGKSVLEIGSGTGALTVALLRGTQLRQMFATDISEQFLRQTIERADGDSRLIAVRCDCNQIPAQNKAFDLIVGRSILHHLLDYDLVLQQCFRILKLGGKAIFFEPILEGKLVIAMYGAMIVDLARRDDKTEFTTQELNKIESVVRHITKSSWYPQTREALEKLEDKYIFTLDGMRKAGAKAGFSNVECIHDDRPVDPTYWSNFVSTMKLIDIQADKFVKYKVLSNGYARTFGQYHEFTHPPMTYFCFTV